MVKILSTFCFCLIALISFGQNKPEKRTRIYGVVIDSENYLPIENVKIIYNNKIVSSTDSNGFFESIITVNAIKNEGLKIVFSKNGFKNYSSFESWDSSLYDDDVNYLVGLNSEISNSFTEISHGDFSYDQTLDKLEDIKSKKLLKSKLDKKRLNNENSFIELDNHYYILSNTNWVEVISLQDSVQINNKKIVSVNELNSEIKRSEINIMNPDEFKSGLYHVITK